MAKVGMEEIIKTLQLDMLQQFFVMQMKTLYQDGWKQEIERMVNDRYDNNDLHKDNYKGVHDALLQGGVAMLDEKSFDITFLSNALRFDFSQCLQGLNVLDFIRRIQKDRNGYSHQPNMRDDLKKMKLHLTAVETLRDFLKYLNNSTWSNAGKADYVRRFRKEIEALQSELTEKTGDFNSLRFKAARLNYLQVLIAERDKNRREYLPLSYKIDDETAENFSLEELDQNPKNQKGFVLSADAGYGKTWSIAELAGVSADKAQTDEEFTPLLIRMGQVTEEKEPIAKTVQEILFPGQDSLEVARVFLQNKKVTLFVDGMDEAAAETKHAARKELEKLMSSCPQLRIIGATRPADVPKFPACLTKYLICTLRDEQVRAFITKQISDPALRERAFYDYFENGKTSFLRNLRSPFYLKCFVEFILSGENAPKSDTDLLNRCMDKMIEREIAIKNFPASVEIINQFLTVFARALGSGRRYMLMADAMKELESDLVYDKEEYASVVAIKDTLVELGVLREVTPEGMRLTVLGFAHEKYKNLYDPIVLDESLFG